MADVLNRESDVYRLTVAGHLLQHIQGLDLTPIC